MLLKIFKKSMKLINLPKLLKKTRVKAGNLTIWNITQNIDPINDIRRLFRLMMMMIYLSEQEELLN